MQTCLPQRAAPTVRIIAWVLSQPLRPGIFSAVPRDCSRYSVIADLCVGHSFPSEPSASRCIACKDKVGSFGLLVTRKAAFHKRRIAVFAVCEVTKAPSAGCCVFL
jgi:hypothetical protein